MTALELFLQPVQPLEARLPGGRFAQGFDRLVIVEQHLAQFAEALGHIFEYRPGLV